MLLLTLHLCHQSNDERICTTFQDFHDQHHSGKLNYFLADNWTGSTWNGMVKQTEPALIVEKWILFQEFRRVYSPKVSSELRMITLEPLKSHRML